MRIIIPGQPIPKARARTFVRGGYTQTFDPQYKKKAEVRKQLESNTNECFTFESLSLKLEFLCEPAKSDTRSIRNLKLWDIHKHTHKPDIDNLEKFILDCMNGTFYADDSQIVEIHSTKKYSQNPCTIIEISVKNYLDVSKSTQELLKIMSPHEMEAFFEDCAALHWESYDDIKIDEKAATIKKFADKWAKTLTKIAKSQTALQDQETYRSGKTLS